MRFKVPVVVAMAGLALPAVMLGAVVMVIVIAILAAAGVHGHGDAVFRWWFIIGSSVCAAVVWLLLLHGVVLVRRGAAADLAGIGQSAFFDLAGAAFAGSWRVWAPVIVAALPALILMLVPLRRLARARQQS
jgi:hypothetical protein